MLPAPQASGQPASWRSRWQNWRDRLLCSPSFRRRALGFAPARWLARRRATALFDVMAGFVYSQVLQACVRLGLFERLANEPATVGSLAADLDLPPARLHRLLEAAASLALLEPRSAGPTPMQARYGLGPLGCAMVGNPALAAMAVHHAAFYADLQDPVALLRGRGGELATYWPYAGRPAPGELPESQVAAYSALMSASQPLVADDILDAYRLGGHQCLLDVGGGEGLFLVAAAKRAPQLQLMLFDLPAVALRAHRRFAAQGLLPRARAIGGDFLRQPLPQGADVISLVRVIHDHDDAAALTLLRAAWSALPPGGVLLLAEPMARTRGAEAMGGAYFGMYLLAMGQGRPRSAAELTSLLRAAGFTHVQRRATHLPLQVGLLVARRGP